MHSASQLFRQSVEPAIKETRIDTYCFRIMFGLNSKGAPLLFITLPVVGWPLYRW